MNDHFQYPPTMFLFTYPFGALPYYVSFVAWNLITLLLYSVAAYSIIPRPATVIVAVTPFAVLANILYGHNAFLSAGLIALALLFIERRPWLSGIFIGLVSYKPQFGVLFPLALLAARNWRAFASAALTGLIFAATAAILFGYNGWISFIDALLDRNLSLSPDKALEIYDLQSVFGFLRYFGASHTVCWATHLTVTSVVAAIICAIWAKPIPYALKAASLCTGVLMVTPYVLAYDICILSIAVAFLIKDGLANGFMPGERAIIFLSWGGLFLLILPVAPFICAAIFYLVTRRIVDYRRDTGLKLAFANSMQ